MRRLLRDLGTTQQAAGLYLAGKERGLSFRGFCLLVSSLWLLQQAVPRWELKSDFLCRNCVGLGLSRSHKSHKWKQVVFLHEESQVWWLMSAIPAALGKLRQEDCRKFQTHRLHGKTGDRHRDRDREEIHTLRGEIHTERDTRKTE